MRAEDWARLIALAGHPVTRVTRVTGVTQDGASPATNQRSLRQKNLGLSHRFVTPVTPVARVTQQTGANISPQVGCDALPSTSLSPPDWDVSELEERAAIATFDGDVPSVYALPFARLQSQAMRLDTGLNERLINSVALLLDSFGARAAELGWSFGDVARAAIRFDDKELLIGLAQIAVAAGFDEDAGNQSSASVWQHPRHALVPPAADDEASTVPSVRRDSGLTIQLANYHDREPS